MSLPPEFLDELRARVGLAAVIGRRIKLTRAGREMKGCCPFHNEKSPSFYVNEDKGFYHCFGCGAHGDAIGFTMAQDGLSFMEAVKALADEAGLAVPESQRANPESEKRAGLNDLLAAAADWYRGQLGTAAGAPARTYLEKRGVPEKLQERFGLGLAPESRDALSMAIKSRFAEATPEMLNDAGLQGESEGRRYDRFRGRLMFPIHDARGRNVGFGGRALGDVQPKYLNSPEGPAFHKGRLLYNLHRAGPAARKAGRLIVVEGYMDVVGLAGAGIDEAVAPLGTAMTEEQMALCWKLVAEPLLAFDGDDAGRRAAVRAATRALPLIQPGKSLAFVALPKGQDPDDLARSGGKPAVEAVLAAALPLERLLFDQEAAAGPLDTPERRGAFKERLKALAGEISHEGLKRDYLSTWLDRADLLLRPAPRNQNGRQQGRPPQGSSRGRQEWRQPVMGALPETRAAAAQPVEEHLGMVLKTLCLNPLLAERNIELLAELSPRTPSLVTALDHLASGTDASHLLAQYRPLANADETEITHTLASFASRHHIAISERQSFGPGSDESLEEAFERRRAAALAYLDRVGIRPAQRDDTDEA